MKRLAEGTIIFKNKVFETHKDFFEPLSKEQHPVALIISCCDSRVEPVVITQSAPGTIFSVKNIGNLVPPYESGSTHSEVAAIDFALTELNVHHIVVCGHSDCNAIRALLDLDALPPSSPIYQWLKPNQHLVESLESETEEDRLNELIRRNILQQMQHLTTYPEVAKRLEKGELHLYGWKYRLQTGETMLINTLSCKCEPLSTILPELIEEEHSNVSLGQLEENISSS